MHRWSKGLMVSGLGCAMAVACLAQGQAQDKDQEDTKPVLEERKPVERMKRPENKVSIPAGAQILLRLEHAITTKSAKIGDPIYAITTFPYAVDGKMLVPAGTYVQGRISAIQRPGRVKGRADLLFHFTTLIYPNGYTLLLPGAVDNVPGMEHSTMKNEEGTIRQDSDKGHDVATAAEAAATGGLIGAAAGGLKGAGIGGAGGAVVGTAIALFSRGKDLRLEQGTSIQMVVQRAIDIDANRIAGRALRGDLQRYDPQ
jgi:type IV secretion system protein VirB10